MKIQVCMWKNCKEKYSEYILQRLERDKERFKLDNVIITSCSCLWNCEKWPSVMFDKHIEWNMTPTKASKMMMNKINWNKPNKKTKQKTNIENSESFEDNSFFEQN